MLYLHRPELPEAAGAQFPVGAAVDDLRRVVTAISAIGSSALGFRSTGTPEEHRVAELVAAEMRAIGLAEVRFEEVPVHAWRFRGGSVTVQDGPRHQAAALASVPPTPAGGISGELVYVGQGSRRELRRLDLVDRIALVDWRGRPVRISEIALELGRRGAKAVVVATLEGGARFQAEGALGTWAASWYPGAPPAVTVRRSTAHDLIERCRAGATAVTVSLDVEIDREAVGRNVVGVWGAENPGAPIVVGAHHDGWFSGAFDNASGVATMLGIARALIDAGWAPRRPVWFVSHTAEEYGQLNVEWSGCYGAWWQAAKEHPRWGGTVPFYLDIEASGRPELPLEVIAPAELRPFVSRWCRAAERAGLLPAGRRRFAPPETGTHQWPFQLTGVPGISVLNWHTSFERTDYHTTEDTVEKLDFDYLAGLSRLYAAILVAAEASADALLDHRSRARDLMRAAGRLGQADDLAAGLAAAADAYAATGTRRTFARLARTGFTFDRHGQGIYLYEQAARDVAQLDAALAHLEAGDLLRAARCAARVGLNDLQRWVSADVQARAIERHHGARNTWQERCPVLTSPDLWHEIAALRGEPGERPYGPWVERSLRHHRSRMAADRDRAVASLIAVLQPRGGVT